VDYERFSNPISARKRLNKETAQALATAKREGWRIKWLEPGEKPGRNLVRAWVQTRGGETLTTLTSGSPIPRSERKSYEHDLFWEAWMRSRR